MASVRAVKSGDVWYGERTTITKNRVDITRSAPTFNTKEEALEWAHSTKTYAEERELIEPSVVQPKSKRRTKK